MLLYVKFNVTYFFSGVVSNVALFCKLGTLFFPMQLSYCSPIFNYLLCFLGIMPSILPHAYKFKYLFSSGNYEVGRILIIPTNDKTISSHGPTVTCSPLLFSNCSFDPSNANHIEDVPIF